jgi:predicted SAM-dependent methyltransferase
LSILYSKGHNPSIGKTWDKHHKELANFLINSCGKKVVEVGGGNFRLANMVTEYDSIEEYTIFDTNIYETNNLNSKIKINQSFFSSKNIEIETIDTIILSHVIEHLYSPRQNLNDMWNCLKKDGQLILSIPNIENMILDKFTNALSFEHTYYTNESLLTFLLKSAGYEVVEKYDFSRHNIFLRCKKINKDNNLSIKKFSSEYEKNKKIYLDFVSHYIDLVEQLNDDLKQKINPKFIFGAHVFTQYLFNFGLKEEYFSSVLDNDSEKISNRLYGTNLKVNSPKILKDVKSPIVVLRVGQFKDEIKHDIIDNINDKTLFL